MMNFNILYNNHTLYIIYNSIDYMSYIIIMANKIILMIKLVLTQDNSINMNYSLSKINIISCISYNSSN